jgi:hypothetical protein
MAKRRKGWAGGKATTATRIWTLKKFLMYITDDSDRRNGPSPFLKEGTGVGIYFARS